MAGAYSSVDLSQLAPPDVVEVIDYQVIKDEMLAQLVSLVPEFTALLESDPAYKVLEVAAYREMLVRQRVNDAAQAVMLAYATGADLDQIAANYNVERLLVTPANDGAVPPAPAVYESDEALRARIPLSLEGYTSAGSEGSYIFHALSASGDVKDASASSPEPGEVVIYVLSRVSNGGATPELIATVAAAINGEKVRPMTDQVTVMSANIINYEIEAELVLFPGPDASVVQAAAHAAATEYVLAQHRMGRDITLSGVYRALHQPGVQGVNLISPEETLVMDDGEAGFCTNVTITVASETDA